MDAPVYSCHEPSAPADVWRDHSTSRYYLSADKSTSAEPATPDPRECGTRRRGTPSTTPPSRGCANITGLWNGGGTVWIHEAAAEGSNQPHLLVVTSCQPQSTNWVTANGSISSDATTLSLQFTPGPLLFSKLQNNCDTITWSSGAVWTRLVGNSSNGGAPNHLDTEVVSDRSQNPSSVGQSTWDAFVSRLETRLQPLIRPMPPPSLAASLPSCASTGNKVGSECSFTPLDVRRWTQPLQCGSVAINFDPSDGSISHLGHRDGPVWVPASTAAGGIASFSYRSYSAANFSVFQREYTSSGDFMKAGVEAASPVGREWRPRLQRGVWASATNLHNLAHPAGCHLIMELVMEDNTAHTMYGAPAAIGLEYTVPGTNGSAVDISLVWSNKTATRLPESMWLSFSPSLAGIASTQSSGGWEMDVMGHKVLPEEVVEGGTLYKHAVGTGVTLRLVTGSDGGTDAAHEVDGLSVAPALFRVETLDSPLVSPGDTNHMLRYNAERLDSLHGGMHFNLHNNLWGTAFPQWYSDNGLARFKVFSPS